jgi:hypothetical protein
MTNPYEHPGVENNLPALVGEVVDPHAHTGHQAEPPVAEERLEILPDVDAAVEAMGTTHEQLGQFLQGFTDAVKSGAVESTYVHFKGFSPSHAYTFKDETGSHDSYALLRSDYHVCTHCNPDAEQWWTLVSFTTGDTLDFADSHPRRIAEQGEYTSERSGHQFISPERIGEIAGIKEHSFGADDPVVEMLAASSAPDTGLFKPVTLRTRDQIDRFGGILSLGHPATEHTRVTLGFDSATDMFAYFGEYGVEWLLKATHDVDVPETPAPIMTDNYDGLRAVLSRIGTWGPERRDQLLSLIEYVDVRGVEEWARPGNIQSLIWSSVKFNDEGGYEVTADANLARKILCDQWDFVAGIYKAADGMYIEGGEQKLGEERATPFQKARLDEDKARVYAEVFSDVLMPVVEQARHDLQIPADIPQTDQVMHLFTRHQLFEKALRIARDKDVQAQRPDVTVPQWAHACEVLDDVRFSGRKIEDWDVPAEGQAVLGGYGLDVERIVRLLKSAPGMSSEQILRDAYRNHFPAIRLGAGLFDLLDLGRPSSFIEEWTRGQY